MKNIHLDEFDAFIHKFINNHFLFNNLLNIKSCNNEKRKILIKALFKKTDFDDLKKSVIKYLISSRLINTKRIGTILYYYKTKEPEYLLAIAQNPISPADILENLINIEQVSYAKKIRSFAKEYLDKKKR